MRTFRLIALVLGAALASACVTPRAVENRDGGAERASGEPYASETVVREAENFFGRGARGLADVLNRVLNDNGPPDGYIKGEEGGGALGVGLRYGHGILYLKDGTATPVYWRGPSLGLDVGGSASKAFILVYDVPTADAVFRRYGGVEGSLYYVGGVGVTYNRNDETVLAPVRVGVGWRQGVNVGYLHLTPRRSWLPF